MSIIQQLLDLKEWSQDSTRYERRLAFRGNLPSTEAGTIPIEWDELSDREREYYRTGPWRTRPEYQKGQLVQPGPGRPGYQGKPQAEGELKKFTKKDFNTFKKQLTKLGCGMYAGGRVGLAVGSGKCITRAVEKLRSGDLTVAEKKIVDAMGDGLGKGGMPKKFWTMKNFVKGEGYFALADFANNLTKGQSLDKSFSNAITTATFGLLDLKGTERDLMKYAKERGLDTKDIKEWMEYAKTWGTREKKIGDLELAKDAAAGKDTMFVGPYDDMLVESRIKELPGKIKNLKGELKEQEKAESIQSGKGYEDMNEMM